MKTATFAPSTGTMGEPDFTVTLPLAVQPVRPDSKPPLTNCAASRADRITRHPKTTIHRVKTQVFMVSGGWGETRRLGSPFPAEPVECVVSAGKIPASNPRPRVCNPPSIPHLPVMSQPYLSLEAELHDAFWDAEDDSSEVRLMETFLKRFPGPSLEIGAGSGRLMLTLVQKGLEVEGLELSRDMLDLGEKRAAKLGVHPVMHEGDMTTWRGPRKFASLLAPAFTLQLAPDPAEALKHWHSLLEDGGGLYLTVFMPYAELLGDLPENEWYDDHFVTLPDGREGLLETRHHLDHERRIVHREHRYTLSGDPPLTHLSRQSVRWIEHPEMLSLLTDCGFRVDRFYIDFDPSKHVADPNPIDFDGILTYEAVKIV
ncbi:MAG: class I SAM-dependent methyltransferase [Verrucomicrobiaceae bacterium]|nr:MAG: class I SAM-dependent methyltransferase [Verrucomicrobiaceae bacterium]